MLLHTNSTSTYEHPYDPYFKDLVRGPTLQFWGISFCCHPLTAVPYLRSRPTQVQRGRQAFQVNPTPARPVLVLVLLVALVLVLLVALALVLVLVLALVLVSNPAPARSALAALCCCCVSPCFCSSSCCVSCCCCSSTASSSSFSSAQPLTCGAVGWGQTAKGQATGWARAAEGQGDHVPDARGRRAGWGLAWRDVIEVIRAICCSGSTLYHNPR